MVAIDPMCVFLFGLSLCGSEKTYACVELWINGVVVRVELSRYRYEVGSLDSYRPYIQVHENTSCLKHGDRGMEIW